MDCPNCKYPDTRVIKSLPEANVIKRRRQCMRCGLRVTTEEQVSPPRKKKELTRGERSR